MVDFKRFERQMKLNEIGWDVQQKWWNSRVLVVGMGGLGCGIVQGLVSSGVGKLVLVDGDKVEFTNLHRQWLFQEKDVGRFKVEVVADWIKGHNSEVQVEVISEFLSEQNAPHILGGLDLWMDGTDQISTKLLMDEWSIVQNTPWVFGAAEQWDGQVSVFNYQNLRGRCFRYADFFSKNVNDSMVGSCQRRGVMGPVVQTIAMVQVTEALKVLGNLSPFYVGKMFCWDGWQSSAYHVSL